MFKKGTESCSRISFMALEWKRLLRKILNTAAASVLKGYQRRVIRFARIYSIVSGHRTKYCDPLK